MRKISTILTGFILILSLHSCVKDHSVSEVIKLNEVTISGIADTVTVAAGDVLQINPVLETPAVSDAAYDYLWYSFTTSMQHAADTLSKEKNLSAAIQMVPGTYSLVFRVMDRSTGVFYKRTATIVVVNDYTPGIMILGEDNGKAALHFLNTANGKYITDVYKKSNEEEDLGANPVSISYYPQVYQMPAQVLVLCKDQRGGVFADPVTFRKTRDLRNSFYVAMETAGNIDVSRYAERWGNLQDYVIIDGRPYNRAVNSGDLLFKPAMLGDFYVSPQVFNENASRPAFYDIAGRRFLAHNNTFGALNTFLAGATDNIINPNNVGLDILYAGGVTSTQFFGLFKTPGSQGYYILRMNINAISLSFTATDKYLMNGTDIDKAASFTSSSALSDYLFYAAGGKCYVYNTLSKGGGMLFDMGADYSIDFLKMNGAELKVGFRNGSQPGKKGGFATFNITTQGGIQAAETRRREGILDRVVDLTDKQ